jgi:hypothetical protein
MSELFSSKYMYVNGALFRNVADRTYVIFTYSLEYTRNICTYLYLLTHGKRRTLEGHEMLANWCFFFEQDSEP